MNDYRKVVQGLPRPSAGQVRNFVDYVCQAHSWYKHLPLTLPGILFFFYLDPNAGCDLLLLPRGRAKYRERTESTQRFHYSWQPTAQYRQRFGYLEYFTEAGTTILLGGPEGMLCTRNPRPAIFMGISEARRTLASLLTRLRAVFSRKKIEGLPEEVRTGRSVLKSFGPVSEYFSEEGWAAVPQEILRRGSVELTGAIHSLSSDVNLWRFRLSEAGKEQHWPEETGGASTFEKIKALCENTPENAREELDRLLEPERQRQKRLMEQAIGTVLRVIYEDAPAA